MTIEEIFSKLAAHISEGIIFHDEMAKAYDFLGLWGYSKCQLYHAFEEKHGLSHLIHYYATHYFRLLQVEEIEKPKLIPDIWYKYSTQAVDTGTKRTAIKELMTKWIEWEQSTKKLYQDMRQELCALNESAAALYIEQYIRDVDNELHHAQKELIKLETVGYDIVHIIEQQEDLHKKYKKKLRW